VKIGDPIIAKKKRGHTKRRVLTSSGGDPLNGGEIIHVKGRNFQERKNTKLYAEEERRAAV